MRRASVMLFVAAIATACEPSLDLRTFLVTSPSVLAVRSDPAEAAPGTSVTLTALYVGPDGGIAAGPFDWAFCDEANPLANLGPVAPACAARTGTVFVELGNAATLAAPIPNDACRLFGPDAPPPQPNEPPGRPVDPDGTGGYYQPVRLAAGSEIALGEVRITCGFVDTTPDQLAELNADTHPNTNPQIDAVTDPALGKLVAEGAGTNTVASGQRLDLSVQWADCDPSAASCTGAEGYAYLDVQTSEVVRTREEMVVSWFATGGTFDDDSTGRPATDPTPNTENGWTAPATSGTVHIWMVLRDDRGGVGWVGFVIDVK